MGRSLQRSCCSCTKFSVVSSTGSMSVKDRSIVAVVVGSVCLPQFLSKSTGTCPILLLDEACVGANRARGLGPRTVEKTRRTVLKKFTREVVESISYRFFLYMPNRRDQQSQELLSGIPKN
jgi:hypothetical protein